MARKNLKLFQTCCPEPYFRASSTNSTGPESLGGRPFILLAIRYRYLETRFSSLRQGTALMPEPCVTPRKLPRHYNSGLCNSAKRLNTGPRWRVSFACSSSDNDGFAVPPDFRVRTYLRARSITAADNLVSRPARHPERTMTRSDEGCPGACGRESHN